MKKISLILLVLVSLILAACGGGGAFSDINLTGRVLDVKTGAPLTSAATVQTSTATVQTSTLDGSFLVGAPKGITQLIVNPPSVTPYPVYTFTFPAQNIQADIGDLWIGPEQVTVTGIIHNAANDNPVANAVVSFAGQYATTDSTGTFTIHNVAYSSENTSSFLGINGTIQATNFVGNTFTTNGNTAISGVVDVGTVLITPVDSDNPPPLPYNIWGIVSPSGLASGTIVTLKDSGGTVVRRFTVGTDARYQFWVNAGQYSIEFANGTHTAPTQGVTLNNSSDVIRADATLN